MTDPLCNARCSSSEGLHVHEALHLRPLCTDTCHLLALRATCEDLCVDTLTSKVQHDHAACCTETEAQTCFPLTLRAPWCAPLPQARLMAARACGTYGRWWTSTAAAACRAAAGRAAGPPTPARAAATCCCTPRGLWCRWRLCAPRLQAFQVSRETLWLSQPNMQKYPHVWYKQQWSSWLSCLPHSRCTRKASCSYGSAKAYVA